jgi:ferric-dicitrate binding protein FerR (iron transport regulator)
MSGDGRGDLPAEFFDLVDEYCSGLIDESGAGRLEAYLLGSSGARRHFAEYFQHHTEIHFAIRAGRAAGAVLERLASEEHHPRDGEAASPWRRHRPWSVRGRWMGLAALVAAAAVVVAWLGWRSEPGSKPNSVAGAGDPAEENVAWLVNAQDCRWDDAGQRPGRDMRAGKELHLIGGLAEIEFDGGARVILQGPAGLRLVSPRSAQLLKGTLTARVPPRARGFTVLTPHNKVVDLGTEFGLSVDEAGAARVRVFRGEVVAYSLLSGRAIDPGVTIRQDQAARLDGRTVDRKPPGPGEDAVNYVRAIEPPPVVTPRTLLLDFSTPVSGTLRDAMGQGIGLTRRLSGTGADLPERDPNLLLRTERRALEFTTTRSDLNTQDRMRTGEYLGVRLRDLGFTGAEDFEIRATIPSIPGLKVVGQFGLYVGSRSDRNIRGGLISWPRPDTYRLFLVNNSGGIDSDIYEVGLMTSGDDLRLALRRIGGRYSLVVDDLTRRSSSTLAIAHPAFLDGETDLDVGLFGANTQSDLPKTLTVRELSVTVWTPQTAARTIAPMEPSHAGKTAPAPRK